VINRSKFPEHKPVENKRKGEKIMAQQQEEKLIVDRLRPTAEMRAAPVDVTMEEKVNVFDLCAEMVKEEGVEYDFCLVGGNACALDVYMQKAGIKRVHVRHESTAGFAMDAWGRLTRRPGFVVCGPGTGLTNLTSGVVEAYAAGAPGVAMVCESGTMDDDGYAGQGCARSEAQFGGISKHARRVSHPATLLFQLKRAFRSAVTPPTGPVIVSTTNEIAGPGLIIPRRVAYTRYTPGYWKPSIRPTRTDPALIEEVVKWLLEAEKPCIIAGHAAHQDDCQEEYRELAHLLGIPSSGRRIARGIISEEDPLCYGRRARGPVFREADRAIVLGLRIGFLEGFGNAPFFPQSVRYCQIHNSPDYTELNLPTEIEIIGNLKEVLKQMIQCVKDKGINKPLDKWEKWRQFIVDTNQSYNKQTFARTDEQVNQVPVHPELIGRYTAELLREEYKNDYIYINDSHTGGAYFASWATATNTGTVMDAAETIGIGHAPGMALAAGLATNREKPILAMVGDGSVGIAAGDFETCVRWDIPVIFLHHNNNTLINANWELFMEKSCSVTGDVLKDSWQTVNDIHYERMFAEVGCHPEFVEKPEQIQPALKRAFEFAMREKKPAFIECFVEPFAIHPSSAQPGRVISLARQFSWDEIPERGKEAIVTLLVTPEITARLPKDYQEGIAAYQKK